MKKDIKTVHEGRGGYVEIESTRYTIDHVEAGIFCIHFPNGHPARVANKHLPFLEAYAKNKNPKWYVGTRKK